MPESFLSMFLSPQVHYLTVFTAQLHTLGRGHCYPSLIGKQGNEGAAPEEDSMQALAVVT